MKPIVLGLAMAACAMPAVSQGKRDLAAHVHGVSRAQIAIDRGTVEINLFSPGMDLVGFEHVAKSHDDKDRVEAAVRILLVPENVVTLPKAAGCRLAEVLSHMHLDEPGHDHGDEKADTASQHSEFHARYRFVCDRDEAVKEIGFPFFDRFEHAQEIDVQFVIPKGVGRARVMRGAGQLMLE